MASGLRDRIDWVLNVKKAFKSARDWSLAADRSHSQITMMRRRIAEAEAMGEEASFEDTTLRDLALAAEVSPVWFSSGVGSPVDPVVVLDARYGNLTTVLEHPSNAGRWSPEAIGAARSLQLTADDDPSEELWTQTLDGFDVALKIAKSALPKLPVAPVDTEAFDKKPGGRFRR